MPAITRQSASIPRRSDRAIKSILSVSFVLSLLLLSSLQTFAFSEESPFLPSWNEGTHLTLLDSQETALYPAIGEIYYENGTFCGATLVSSNLIVTAAHCLVDPYRVNRGYFTGDLKQSLKFKVQVGRQNYSFTGIHATSFGQSWGPSDVGLVLLASPVPTRVAKPMKLLRLGPSKGEEGIVVGFGCNRTHKDRAGFYRIPDQGGSFGKKQIVYRKIGTPLYQGCPGDSGGPLIRKSDLGIYGVVSSMEAEYSDSQRRNAKENRNTAGDITQYYEQIQEKIQLTKDICFNSSFNQGRQEFHVGLCMSKQVCRERGFVLQDGNCPNSPAQIGCCSDNSKENVFSKR